MNESDFQAMIARWCIYGKNHLVVLPNVHFYGNESDVLSFTRAGLAHVFEIKISRSDLRADFRKEIHTHLQVRRARVPNRWTSKMRRVTPSYFWFVAPEPVLQGVPIPDYAGIMVPGRYGRPRVVRPAPRLHSDKLDDAEKFEVARKMNFRYWRPILQNGVAP